MVNNKLEILALVIALLAVVVFTFSAVVVFTFYLLTDYNSSTFFLEPIVWIRVPEICLGIFSIPILLRMIWRKTTEGEK
jgi:hypothetical protein